MMQILMVICLSDVTNLDSNVYSLGINAVIEQLTSILSAVTLNAFT